MKTLDEVRRKGRAPVSKELLDVRFPRCIEAVLDNGVVVLAIEDRRFPLVSLQIQIPGAGPIHDPIGAPGLASVTASMLREGTHSRDSRQIAEAIEELGATISFSAPPGSTDALISVSGLSESLSEWLGLVIDILLNPRFPPDELARLKQRLKAELRRQRSSPTFLANERLASALYGAHPLAQVSAGPGAIDILTPAALARWHAERYTPRDTIVCVVGDVCAMDVIEQLGRALASWTGAGVKKLLLSAPPRVFERRLLLVDRPDSPQTTIAMGNIAINRRDPDYAPMAVMDRVVGGGPAARLFRNLREQKGYAYRVSSSLVAEKYAGPWKFTGEIRAEATGDALREFLRELEDIRGRKVPEEELLDAKRSLVVGFVLLLERRLQLLNHTIARRVHGFPLDYWDAYCRQLMAVTADDVQRVAQRYADANALRIVAVGAAKAIKPALERYGPVELFDTEGAPLE